MLESTTDMIGLEGWTNLQHSLIVWLIIILLFLCAEDVDYDSTTIMLTFESKDDGMAQMCAKVGIIDDKIANEPDEMFSVRLVGVPSAGNAEACITIKDNDSKLIGLIICMHLAPLSLSFNTSISDKWFLHVQMLQFLNAVLCASRIVLLSFLLLVPSKLFMIK